MLAEVSYFINTRVKRALGAKAAAATELALIEDIQAGSFSMEPVAPEDWPRIARTALNASCHSLRGSDPEGTRDEETARPL
ncbi:hypothetical protein OG895_18115 [Streptomyces sp. NBC_00201]|uniref:hypothetical protein n=1 Tax=Streptomyces sp. NBC_00201 TaxID=2975679 RepID=UPI002253ACA8|nr:hypothetical protein [Streptomyces sp. NBC_00201]MCX5247118.1 hypothetical protein [Streptomyces sp. NBC_00201]